MFDFKKYKERYTSGDLLGLEYLEETLIEDIKEKNKKDNNYFYTNYDYIINLFYAVRYLNTCNDIYETSSPKIADNFPYDMYFDAKGLLFKEIKKEFGLDLDI